MITFDDTGRVFNLHTKNTTYQMKADRFGVLLHTYYGPRISDFDLSCLIRYSDRGFSPNPPEAGCDRTYSLDTLPQEFSGCGAGDYRLPSIELETPDGSHVADLRYAGFEVRPGKYSPEGLPAFFGTDADADTLVIFMEDRTARVVVELYYGVFEDYDLICRSARVVNRGEGKILLRQISSLCLDFQRADLDLITFDGGHVKERCPHRAPVRDGVQSVGSVRGMSGHQHNPFVMLCERGADEEHGLCCGAMLLYSGNFNAAVELSQFGDTRLTMGIHPFHFCWTLAPGESFTAPEAALVCSAGGFGAMSRSFHRAIRAHLLRDPWKDSRKPVLVNSWEPFCCDFDMDKLLALAKESAALGAELFVLDDGWFGRRDRDDTSLGDWYVNEKKLPGGLKHLSRQLARLGMKLGLWVEPEMVNESSELYRAHPDWVLNPPGRPYVRGRDQLVLDFTRADVRDCVYSMLRKVLEGADIAYLKYDMNRGLAQVWSPSLPASRQGEVYHRYVLGVYELLERFRRDFPDMLIEGCAGGGGRFDAGALYYTPQIWCSDNTDAIDRLRIQYGTSFAYPPCTMGSHVSAVPNGQTGRYTPFNTRAAVAMSGTFGYELDLGGISPEEKELTKQQIKTYQDCCALVQNGDYYRLSAPEPDGAPAAWAHVSRDRRDALVTVVSAQTHAAPPFRTMRLQGLDPALRYRINETGELWPGDVLMSAGCPLPVMGEYESLCLRLRAE